MNSGSAPGSPAYLAAQRAGLLRFAADSWDEQGFGWLETNGMLDERRPVELWITARMTHVFSLGVLADETTVAGGPGREELEELAEHGVKCLLTHLFDDRHQGWFSSVGRTGPRDTTKQSYGHAFVLLAACSALLAEVPGADELMARALTAQELHFWDDDEGLVPELWDRSWTRLDPYRGLNANMHTVEAYLAAADVTSAEPRDSIWFRRAGRIASRVLNWAEDNDWRIPEHYDEHWNPLLDLHREEPTHPFRPYGATVGHGLEWARLVLPFGLNQAATALAERAISDGWAADGADGFIYTTDWSGRPVARTRMHWVVAEAINTAQALHHATGEQRWADAAATWWRYVDRYLVDRQYGSWHHELDTRNRPAQAIWPGKPDVYHAYQAALLPALQPGCSFAGAVRGGLST
ncbi:MAG TPA: AGE family epimerase/isomerase [Nocardioides sp.]|uniref:AGE family epimerase/isomerase n=1 Tax=Nocardioides sp. TaxID=35761 RepID=UPI002C001F52|nr:AGE family epimerase/isomerase [Nocardioides sp.]HTW17393.1 AGE family epimerase/isomerase [Nocardioides sp.]